MATPEQMSPAPERQPVLSFVTPDKRDLLFWEMRDSRKPDNQTWEYGDAHWDKSKYRNYELVFVAPADTSGWQKWFYAANRNEQEEYNYEIQQNDSILVRTFLVKRDEYERGLVAPTDPDAFTEPAAGTADTTFTDFEFTHSDIKRVGGELDSLFILVEQRYFNDPANGKETTSWLGGGTVTTVVDRVADGTAPDAGFLIRASEVSPLANGSSIKTTQTIDSFPTLTEYLQDPQTNVIIRIDKDIIVPGASTGSIADGDVTEVQALDKWRSIKIRSRFNSDPTAIAAETIPAVFSYSFPPVLNSVTINRIWAFASSNYKYAYDEDFAMDLDITEARTVSCEGRIKRLFSYDAAALLATYPPVDFFPEPVTIRRGMWAYYAAEDDDGNDHAWAIARYQDWQIPPTLHAAINVTLTDKASGATSGITVNGENTASLTATTPAALPTGTWITIDVDVLKAKFGLYEVQVKQIKCP